MPGQMICETRELGIAEKEVRGCQTKRNIHYLAVKRKLLTFCEDFLPKMELCQTHIFTKG